MTKITFLGTGEAIDPDRTNTSYLIENQGRSIMVDCGYDSAKSLMRYLQKTGQSLEDSPDALLLTHEHGDHMAGIPLLLLAIWEETNRIVGNKGQLEILSSNPELLNRVYDYVERDYKGFAERLKKEGPSPFFKQIDIKEGQFVQRLHVRAALTSHSVPNFAYRFMDMAGMEFAISGDGALTEESRKLFRRVGVLIHEGFYVHKSAENHASIEDVVNYAIGADIPRVYIVHVNREERKKSEEIEILKNRAILKGVELFLPNDHDSITL